MGREAAAKDEVSIMMNASSSVLALGELQRWGYKNLTLQGSDSCMQLYQSMSRNYPCMVQGVCSPFNNATFDVVLVVLFVIVITIAFVGGQIYESKRLSQASLRSKSKEGKR